MTLNLSKPDAGAIGWASAVNLNWDSVEAEFDDLAGVKPGVAHGRLSLSSTEPVPTSDQDAKTTLYYLPFKSTKIALYAGAGQWTLEDIGSSGLSVSNGTLDTSTAKPYDVFLYLSGGSLTLELVAWSSDSARSTALAQQDGALVKSGAPERRYLGTIRSVIDGGAGKFQDSAAKRYVWNTANRVCRHLVARDTTSTWQYSSNSWRAARNDTSEGVGRVGFVVGDPAGLPGHWEAVVKNVVGSTTLVRCAGGVGLDSATVNLAQGSGTIVSAGGYNIDVAVCRSVVATPGYHYLQRLEISQGNGGTTTWYGSDTFSGVTLDSCLLASLSM